MCTMCLAANFDNEGCPFGAATTRELAAADGLSTAGTPSPQAYATNYEALLSGYKWDPNFANGATVMTYSFNSEIQEYQRGILTPDIANARQSMPNDREKDNYRHALEVWEDISGLEFIEVADGQGQMAVHEAFWVGEYGANFNGIAYYPGATEAYDRPLRLDGTDLDVVSDVFIDSESSFRLDLLLHEIGHAIGLKHTFETTTVAGRFYDEIDPSMDNGRFSVMSYDRTYDQNSLGSLDDDAARALYGDSKSKITSTYELDTLGMTDVLGELRDFDGNQFGNSNGWRKIGEADVQGDGDTEHVYVNSGLGRWATLGPDSNDLIDFGAHGGGGDTRIVGNYVDPLVALGLVVSGSGSDSQTRFQRDLENSNLSNVLGFGDYDNDGLQEMYLSLGDGTAYLHTYLHADGNIRYANYQDESQVVAFMQDNGVGSSVYDQWFA